MGGSVFGTVFRGPGEGKGVIKACRKQCLDCTGVSGSHVGRFREKDDFGDARTPKRAPFWSVLGSRSRNYTLQGAPGGAKSRVRKEVSILERKKCEISGKLGEKAERAGAAGDQGG